jgi:hypothetical protein
MQKNDRDVSGLNGSDPSILQGGLIAARDCPTTGTFLHPFSFLPRSFTHE